MTLFDRQMLMFEYAPSLPKADDNGQWLKLCHGRGFVTVPEAVVKWQPGWNRQWGYVKVKPAVAVLHHWHELENGQGWVHLPPFQMDVPMDALCPLPLSSIHMPVSVMPLSVIVAHPNVCSLYDFAEASFAAVAVTMTDACEPFCGHCQNESRQGELRIQPPADDLYAAARGMRPTVVVPNAICHDAVVVWDRRAPCGDLYQTTAFGVQIEFSQWLSDLPRLRLAVLTFNGVSASNVSPEEPEELAVAVVLGGFQLGVCFGNLDDSVVVAANELMLNIARCGVQPKVLQEDVHQVVFQLEYPSASSAVAGRKPSSHSSAVAGSKPSCARSAVAGLGVHQGISYNNIAADLLTAFQRHAMLRIRDEFMSFFPKKYKKWREKDGSLAIVGFPGQSAPLRTKPKRAGRP
jgi:hypothetical protein